MTQKSAYTTAEVIAAGMALRARGHEPDRPGLWNELGRRGQSSTAWKVWLAHRDSQLPVPDRADGDGVARSPELEDAIAGHTRALATVIACAQAETERRLMRRIDVLEKALLREQSERESLDRMVDALETELAARDALLASRQGTNPSRLILPGRP